MGRILIIDDEQDLRSMLRAYMEAHDYQIEEASTGRQGLEAYLSWQPDLVITDIIMPDINGIDLVKRVRQRDRQARIIVISGYQEELATVQRLGVYASLVKPPELKEILRLADLITKRAA